MEKEESKYKRGGRFTVGKTKEGYAVKDHGNLAIFENKPDITKHNDPDQTEQMEGKEIYATTTTCRIFEFLREAGIPVAYIEQFSGTEFLTERTDMIPLEVICRRFADGSYLDRCPQFKTKEEGLHRFSKLVFEIFLKTTNGSLILKDGKTVVDGLTPKTDDPLILNPGDDLWNLYHPKQPEWEKGSDLEKSVKATDVLPDNVRVDTNPYEGLEVLTAIEILARKSFLLLEGMWRQLGIRLGDFKLEFGVTADGKLVVSDVISNDEWRIKTLDWKELSKELFRQGEDMEDVKKAYNLVAQLVEDYFSYPKQAIVFWRGSDKDEYPEDLPKIAGVEYLDIVRSGHKSTALSLNDLNKIETDYPGGAVITALVGMSNGLGPILASHTHLPVISVSVSGKKNPEDVASSTRMPSYVPNMTMLPSKSDNHILAALNILSEKNPAAYAYRRYQIESQDANVLVF